MLEKQKAFTYSATTALTRKGGLRLAPLIMDRRWNVSTTAKTFMVFWPIAKRWTDCYRAHGQGGMVDMTSSPRTCPHCTEATVVKKVVDLSWRKRLGLSKSETAWAWRPRPCTRCWCDAGSTGCESHGD